jgi:sugar/nucleoside kinase (ribokinase family)
MTPRFGRLLHLGNVVIDIVLDVPALPERGGDVLATGTLLAAGGGFNVLAAAARQGLRAAYAGCHGSGPLAALARAALAEAGIEVLQPPKAGGDTGFVVSIVDAGGERTFVTSPGAEATMTAADLAGISAGSGDAVCLSGYGLLYPANQAALLDWLGRLGEAVVVFADPGPLAHLIPPSVLDRVMARADWWSCNAREAERLTGHRDPAAAASALAARVGQQEAGQHAATRQEAGQHAATRQAAGQHAAGQHAAGQHAAGQHAAGQPAARPDRRGTPGVLVRTGPGGCLLCHRGAAPVHVPGFRVAALDTTGAGDAHTGTFIAALAGGADEIDAARTANAAAALSVTRHGPATAPTAAELARFLSGS